MEPNISGMTPEAKTGNDTVLSDNLNGASPSMQDGFAGMTADPQKLFQHTVDLDEIRRTENYLGFVR